MPSAVSTWTRIGALTFLSALIPTGVAAQVDLGALQDEAVQWLQDYISINTINPPGNEIRGARFFAEIFDAEGITYEIAESASGRGNIWARLEGGSEPALVLLHHMDVVPADERFWSTDPLSGDLRDGYIYGRGALDTKTSGILHLALLATSAALASNGTVFAILLGLQAAGLGLALVARLGVRVPPAGLALYYVLITWATLVALARYLRFGVPAVWEKAEGTR